VNLSLSKELVNFVHAAMYIVPKLTDDTDSHKKAKEVIKRIKNSYYNEGRRLEKEMIKRRLKKKNQQKKG
jgi:DNA topoisomerase VI subunit B